MKDSCQSFHVWYVACFQGAKFTANSKGMRIIEKDGTSLALESQAMEQHLSYDTKELLVYVKQVSCLPCFKFNMEVHCSYQNQSKLKELKTSLDWS